MEYRIFNAMRRRFIIPYYIRVVLGIFLIILAIAGIIIPVIPGIPFFIIGVILFIPGEKLRHVIKLRKSLVYMAGNLHDSYIIRQKMYDIASHVKKILNQKK